MEMDAPFTGATRAGMRTRQQRDIQIAEARQRGVAPLHHLVQVRGFSEGRQMRRNGLVRRTARKIYDKRGAELESPDADARGAKAIERLYRIFELDGAMAAVEAHTNVISETGVRVGFRQTGSRSKKARAGRPELPRKEINCLEAGLERAVRFRFDVEVNPPACLVLDAYKPLDDTNEIRRHHLPIAGAGCRQPCLVGQRRRRDSAVDVVRHQRFKNGDEIERVGDAGIRTPVGGVHVGLHRLAVKGPVRKAVDEGDIQTFSIEERSKLSELRAFEEFPRIARTEPQTKSERLDSRQPPLQLRCDLPDRREGRRPAIGRMDVGAVGEVKGRIGAQEHDGRVGYAVVVTLSGATRNFPD
jgi:hypothetical protein